MRHFILVVALSASGCGRAKDDKKSVSQPVATTPQTIRLFGGF